MSIQGTPESSRGVFDAVKGALGLFSSTNKTDGITESTNPLPIDEYESTMSEKEIIELVWQWKRSYAVYFNEIDKSQKLAFDYWVGKHRSDDGETVSRDYQQQIDNLIFEAIETFLPIATRANPTPVVSADPSEQGQKLASDIKVALEHEADQQKLRRKLARMTRSWTLNKIGALKVTWDVSTKSIKTDVVNVKKMIFDKDGFVDDGGVFKGEYIGEKKQATADRLTEMFPKKKDYIKAKCKGKMGTKLEYTEWWYKGRDVFYTHEDEVLGKYKNPNWNYDGEGVSIDPATGEEVHIQVQGTNHLKEPTAPYIFLSIFNTGVQPHDETSLILQNIPIQDRINRRYRQIDQNVKSMNNGLVVSGRSFTEEQASQAASALRRGVAIRVPDGNVADAVQRFPAEGLPGDVFKSLEDDRNELRNIFGTSGSTPQGTEQQKTVRGKIMINQMDSSRIGGGVTECIEQVADTTYNYWVQMMFVYYDEEHFISTAGSAAGVELISLKNSDFPGLKTLTITVKEGSLVPKDPLTQRNEAIDLWSAQAIDPLSFYRRLDFPDPAQATQQLILWQMFQKGQVPPQAYLPSFEMPGMPQQQGAPPGAGMAPPGAGVGPVQNPDVDVINGPEIGVQGPPPQSGPAVQSADSQLLKAVPIPKA